MKKLLSVLLSLVIVSTLFAPISSFAFGSGLVETARNINLDTTYISAPRDDDHSVNEQNSGNWYYQSFRFTLPASGKVRLRLESEYPAVFEHGGLKLFKSTDLNNPIALYTLPDIGRDYAYNASKNNYYVYLDTNISAGTYFLAWQYVYLYENEMGPYNISVNYTPVFGNATVKKLTKGKKSFKAYWYKASNATGYELQYSTKKNMSSAKKVRIVGASKSAKTIKSLKKKKTYYVRIRSYKTMKINGKSKTYYGKWSAKKRVKTK